MGVLKVGCCEFISGLIAWLVMFHCCLAVNYVVCLLVWLLCFWFLLLCFGFLLGLICIVWIDT